MLLLLVTERLRKSHIHRRSLVDGHRPVDLLADSHSRVVEADFP